MKRYKIIFSVEVFAEDERQASKKLCEEIKHKLLKIKNSKIEIIEESKS